MKLFGKNGSSMLSNSLRMYLIFLFRNQEDMKQEEIEVVYSYWDGSGHRKSVKVIYPFANVLRLLILRNSAKRGTKFQLFLKKLDSKFQNCEVLTLIT